METRRISTKTRRRWPLEFFIFGLFCLAIFLFFLIIGAGFILDFIIGLLSGLCFTAAWYEWKWRPIQETREVAEWQGPPVAEEEEEVTPAPPVEQLVTDSSPIVPETPALSQEAVASDVSPATILVESFSSSPTSSAQPLEEEEASPVPTSEAVLVVAMVEEQEEKDDSPTTVTVFATVTPLPVPVEEQPMTLEEDALPLVPAVEEQPTASEEDMPTLVSPVQPFSEPPNLQTEPAASEVPIPIASSLPEGEHEAAFALLHLSEEHVEALAATPNEPSVEGYCVKCKTKRVMIGPQRIIMKSGHHAMQGTCPVCGIKLFRIVKEDKHTTA